MNLMEKASDPALDRMTTVVKSLVEIMKPGKLPAVDFADERAVLSEGGLGVIGTGEASGQDRAKRAAELALADVIRQLKGRD